MSLPKFSKILLTDLEEFQIRPRTLRQKAKTLNGGMQRKIRAPMESGWTCFKTLIAEFKVFFSEVLDFQSATEASRNVENGKNLNLLG